MTDAIPAAVPYCILGAGVHGLSTAWHLARELKSRSRGTGADVVVLDKTAVGAGASGIACGVVRNYYVQPAMGELMAHSVDVWESDAEALHYSPVGYLAVAGDVQRKDFESIAARHEKIGYRARFIQGEQQVFDYMRGIFPDWRARGLSVCIHELQGGFALNRESMNGLAQKAQAEGVRIVTGVTVTGFEMRADGTVHTVKTDRGDIAVDHVVVGVGPWIKQIWEKLGLSHQVDVLHNGTLNPGLEMWTYWQLQEGEIQADPDIYRTADGRIPPVMHVDSTEPLLADDTGRVITNDLWGIYFKRDRHGVQGGAVPIKLGHTAQVDPYGPDSPHYTVREDFAPYWTAGLAHCLERFRGCSKLYQRAPTGGIGCFTVDNFPVFDWMRPNVYVIADSNHGYKMIGVGKEVARVLMGEQSRLLHPFRFGRFAEGALHPRSSGPFPWT
ncbi:MAG: FAD-binding oxidoreductase [Gemmatimonadetes bacterium]|nr:FAD-binding oxidoreductase [Gemmatimonadota bacterium]